MKNWLLAILKGAAIGVANLIPGVSGGTLMVTMNIYDLFIHSVTHLFKEFKKSVRTLLPYIIGIALAFLLLSGALKSSMTHYPFPTAFAFIGLIVGGLPVIFKECRQDVKKPLGAVLFIVFLALTIGLQLLRPEETGAALSLSFAEVVKLVLLGALASATMVIPGVSGSMILMLLGYYWVVIGALSDLKNVLSGNFSALGILLPFAVGIVIGIFGIAKLIEMLLQKQKGYTYCAILGLVVSSPVVIVLRTLQDVQESAQAEALMHPGAGVIIACVCTFALGFLLALCMTRLDGKKPAEK